MIPAVEIRSSANLTLAADWNLQPLSASGTALARVGGEPMTLTLRAAGNLNLGNSLSDGFAAANGAAVKTAITPGGLAQTGPAASYRLVGGADLTAADPLATQAGAAGNVVIGRATSGGSGAKPPDVLIRTTTGSIDIAAAHDIQLLNSQARAYTTGTPVAAAGAPGIGRIGIPITDLIRNASASLGPFFENAGAISLVAGNDVLGAPAVIYDGSGKVQYVTDWWYRYTDTLAAGTPAAFWSRYDLFAQGVASFGGGNVRVGAGRNVVDLDVSTPTSGFTIGASGTPGTTDFKPAQSRWFPGGTLDVTAGGSIVGGLYDAGGAKAVLSAGGSIGGGTAAGSYPATQLFYMDTDWNVSALGSAALGTLTNPALLAGTKQNSGQASKTDVVFGLAPTSRALLESVAGDLSVGGARPAATSGGGGSPGAAANVAPDELTLAAPSGSVASFTDLAQRPVDAASLRVLANGTARLAAIQVAASESTQSAVPGPLAQTSAAALFTSAVLWTSNGGRLDVSDRNPVQVVSETGDVSVIGASFSARPLRLIAERDLLLDTSLQIQQQPSTTPNGGSLVNELSLFQAGRDLRFGNAAGSTTAGVRVAGPGDLLLVAGRDIDLGRGAGVVSVGNQGNPLLLPSGGANITFLAGVHLSDYAQAATREFQLVGSGLANFPAALAVQLEALKATGGLLAAADAERAAAAFAALTPAEQRARVAQLVGEAVLASGVDASVGRAIAQAEALSQTATDAAAAGLVSGSTRTGPTLPVPGSELLPGQYPMPAGATAAQMAALQVPVRAALTEALQSRALGDVLATYANTLDAPTHSSLTLAVSPYTSQLVAFVAQRTGVASDPAGAAQRFTQLPIEQQALFMNQVLGSELRAAGRASLSGARVDYLRGYAALDALYPGSRAIGNISLANSQAKTSQSGSIRLNAPGGSVNVGDLSGSGLAKSASDLGLVTVAGGSIDAAVRYSLEVNQSRVFTLAVGDVLLWASLGNLDAGRGAKTVVGAPPPLVTIDKNGRVVVDISGSFSGSGIAVLDSASSLDLYAAQGEINTGDAGIKSAGNAFFGAIRFVGADNLSVGGLSIGAPPPAPTGGGTAGLANLGQAVASSVAKVADAADDDERKRRQRRRNLLLDFLGFGSKKP